VEVIIARRISAAAANIVACQANVRLLDAGEVDHLKRAPPNSDYKRVSGGLSG